MAEEEEIQESFLVDDQLVVAAEAFQVFPRHAIVQEGHLDLERALQL